MLVVEGHPHQEPTILLVAHDPVAARALRDGLGAGAYRIWQAEQGAAALSLLEKDRPDLIILDPLLPDVDGLVLCSTLKAVADVPIIICSASPHPRDAVLALKLGADDFIARPFDSYELEARVAAVLRRARQAATSTPAPRPGTGVLQAGRLAVDRARRRVTLAGAAIRVTPTEYRVLVALADRPGEVVSRAQLARAVSSQSDPPRDRRLDVHIARLRRKLQADGQLDVHIEAVRGSGYRLGPPRTAPPDGADRTPGVPMRGTAQPRPPDQRRSEIRTLHPSDTPRCLGELPSPQPDRVAP